MSMAKITQVQKRDGSLVPFDQPRITNAISKAILAVTEKDGKLAVKLSEQVTRILKRQFKDKVPHVEEIQDVIEMVLVKNNLFQVAKAYILYRKQHEQIRETRSTLIEVGKIVDDYLKHVDWRVKENANIAYSMSGLLLHLAGGIIANYTLDRIYPEQVAQAHRDGDYHLHNLYFGIVGYCAGWSLKQLLLEGISGIPGAVASGPAKHLDTALLQMANFIGAIQNEWAGAQAFNSFDTLLAPFVRYDQLNYKQVKQTIQQFVFNVNTTSRWGGQSPFTNLTFDWQVPEDLKNEPVVVAGKVMRETYKEFQPEMNIINKAFIEVLIEGDKTGRPFTFPIPTYNISRDWQWDSENSKFLFEMTAKYGLPYFANFVNSDLNPSDIRSMCCRLRLDLRELRKNITGGLFGSGDSTGSIGVVTINMPRIGYITKNKKQFFERLSYLMELAKTSLEIKREVVDKNMSEGLIPYTRRYLGTLKNHFSTIGLVGMNEACLNLLGVDIAHPEGKEFAVETLNFMRGKLVKFQEETGNIYNLEATPAEGTSYRLAKIDKQKYPKIITSGEATPYYTGATYLPVDKTSDPIEVLEHQEDLQTLYTGGTVFHAFLGEKMSSGEACKNFVKKVMKNTHLPYLTITPTYSICPEHGYISGEHFTCPIEVKDNAQNQN